MSSEKAPTRKEFDPTPRLTLCLAMDLKGSTTAALKLSSKRLDRFNLALINQLTPHLEAVGLEETVVKFTGDGWLVMTDVQEDVAPLCCLAIIMASRFQLEMSKSATIAREKVPAMRLAICWGRDLEVVLHNGQREFVGSSVRHAVRALQLCRDNEVLIDETVRTWIHHDFETTRLDMEARLDEFEPEKMEEELVLHVLDRLRVEAADDHDAPVYFVNTLAIIGRSSEAGRLAKGISDQLQHEAVEPGADDQELLWRWNRLLASNVDYETARGILNDLREAGLRPDATTMNALIDKAQDYRTESKWLQAMIQDGVRPNVFTFNTLIDKANDPDRIEKWLSRMEVDGVEPNQLTLNTLIRKAKDHALARNWLRRMEQKGIQPDATTYQLLIGKSETFEEARTWLEKMFEVEPEVPMEALLSLMTKDMTHLPADDLLQWYIGLRWHPAKPMHRAIAAYRRKGKIRDALRLALDYPHTQTALKLVRERPDEALEYFHSVLAFDPDHANGAYALGLSLAELGRLEEARPWLQRAHELAAQGHRKDELSAMLQSIEAGHPFVPSERIGSKGGGQHWLK